MMTSIGLEKHTWQTLQKEVEIISPSLARIINSLDPKTDLPLYKIRYPFGSLILEKGVFHLPNTLDQLVPLDDPSILDSIRKDLRYNSIMPLGLVSHNCIESYVQINHRIHLATLLKPSRFISLWSVLDNKPSYHDGPIWTVSSGARSICMLPKITDASGYKNLKIKYKMKLPVPAQLSDHWKIFTSLTNNPDFQQEWYSEIIFFSKQWFEHKDDEQWQKFYHFLFDEAWQKSAYKRNQFIFDSIFSIAQENKNLRPNPYIADTMKHLVAMASGAAPGFTPAVDNTAAPIEGLQKIFLEDYGLKKYAPIIMHSHHFSLNENQPIYYSFQIPTTTVFSPRSRKLSSVMSDMQELKYIMEALSSEILKGNLGVEKTPLYDLAKNVNFSYYHSDKDKFGEIAPATEVSKLASNFTQSILDDQTYCFPEFGPFFRGCIAIYKGT